MTPEYSPNASVAWLRAKADPEKLAGAAFLIDSHIAVTCAHVVRDHLGLGDETPGEAPRSPVMLRFEALQREIEAEVITGGWRHNGRDVALLRLDEPLRDLDPAGLARSQPRPRESCYIYGAIGGYQGSGQTVYAQLAAQRGVDGRRQLNAPSGGEHGYKVRRGFSGAPVFDELGNTIWGMVVTVETDPGIYVAFSIPAEDLREALRAVHAGRNDGQEAQTRAPEPVDEIARDAMTALRQEYEQRLAEQRAAYEQQIQELRQAVQFVAEMARKPASAASAKTALAHLAEGDTEAAERILQDLLDRAPERTPEERGEAAALARSLGVLAYLDNTDRALRAYEMATRLDPDDVWAWIFLARLNRRTNRLRSAEDVLERARELALAQGDQRTISAVHTDLGDVRVARGDLSSALDAYAQGLAIDQRLAAQDPSNSGWQRDLSVSFDRIGDVQRARGDLDAALKAYQDSLAIREKLAAQDPSNSEWQRDLSVSFNKIGDVESARGNLDAALKAYGDGLAIREKLAAQDPSNSGWQRDLSVSFDNIGDVQSARGDLDAALMAYRNSLAIAEKLAAQDPSNSEWQRDLSVSFNKIGDVESARGNLDAALKAYQDSHAIFEKLAAQDPSNTEWQRDLSVSYDRIGDMQSARGNLDAALKAYGDGLAIREKLAAQDPSNSGWQRDLSVSFDNIGDVQSARGDLDAALKAYQKDLAIAETLAAQDPSNAEWQRDVWVSMWRLAEMEGGGVSWTEVLEKMESMKARGVLLPTDEPFLEQARAHAAQ